MRPRTAVATDTTYQTLIHESGSKSGNGWRLPAGEIEAAVISAIRIERDVWLTFEVADKGSIDDQELLTAVERVEIRDADLLIDVEASVCLGGCRKSHRIVAPFTKRRRGVEQRIVLVSEAGRTPDLILIRRIVRVIGWAEEVTKGSSLTVIAAREGISPEFITHNISLALLSPSVLIAIADGRQRPDITASSLSRARLPASWVQQDQLLLE